MPKPPGVPEETPGKGKKRPAMSIVSSAPNGIQVSSAAKDSTGTSSTVVLATQAGAAADEVIVPEAVGSNNEGNLEASPVYPGRMIMIRENEDGLDTVGVNTAGTGYSVDDIFTLAGGSGPDDQSTVRVLTVGGSGEVLTVAIETVGAYNTAPSTPDTPTVAPAGGTGCLLDVTFVDVEEVAFILEDNSLTLKVHQPWIRPPELGNQWRVCYIVQDMATVNGLGLISKRVNDYSASRHIRINTGGWFGLFGGASIEHDDRGSTTLAAFTLEGSCNFDAGYFDRVKGITFPGGYMIGADGSVGEISGRFNSSARARCNNFFWTSVRELQLDLLSSGNIWRDSKIFNSFHHPQNANTATILGEYINCTFQGELASDISAANIRSTTILTDTNILSMFGLYNNNPSNATYSLLRGVKFSDDCPVFVTVQDEEDWEFVNPIWTVADTIGKPSPKIVFGSRDNSSSFTELFSLDLSIGQVDGTPISGAKFYIVEQLLNDDIPHGSSAGDGTSDALGEIAQDILLRTLASAASGDDAVGADAGTGFDFNNNGEQVDDTIDRNDGGDWGTDGFVAGMNIRAAAATVSANNGSWRIKSLTSTVITLVRQSILVTSTGDNTVTFDSDEIIETRRGDFALRIFEYTFSPFIGGLTHDPVDPAIDLSVSLPPDTAITETTQATAISDASGITVRRTIALLYDADVGVFTVGQVLTGTDSGATGLIVVDDTAADALILDNVIGVFTDGEQITDPITGDADVNGGNIHNTRLVIAYDGGTGTAPTIGETITIANAGGDTVGILDEFIGDAVSGLLVLLDTFQNDPDNNASITGDTSSFAALSDTTGGGSSVDEKFHWYVDADGEDLTAAYDYLQARLAEDTLVENYEELHIWGADEVAQILFSGGSGFFTERNVSRLDGVWVGNRGAGVADFFTSDGGVQVSPPAQFSITISDILADTEVRIFEDTGACPELAGTESSGTSFTYNYTFGGSDVDVFIQIHKQGFEYIRLDATLSNANQTIPLQQRVDRTEDNPA